MVVGPSRLRCTALGWGVQSAESVNRFLRSAMKAMPERTRKRRSGKHPFAADAPARSASQAHHLARRRAAEAAEFVGQINEGLTPGKRSSTPHALGAIGLRTVLRSRPACSASMRFVFLGSRFCLRLPSDLVLPQRPCLQLTLPVTKVRRGLPPPSDRPCRAHNDGHHAAPGGCSITRLDAPRNVGASLGSAIPRPARGRTD